MSIDPFGGALDPFAWWDIAATYDKYSGFFDLVIYCSLFIALCHVIFTRRFTGRPGKVMATTIGLALGISMTLAEQQWGWNLRQAGALAVFIVLLLVGFLLLHVMLRVHISWKLAAPLTYVLIYLFVRGMSPSMLNALAQRVPFLNLLSAIIFLLCIWQVGVALWPKGHGTADKAGSDSSFIAGLDRKHEEREIKVEKRIKRKLAPQAQRETVKLQRNLRALMHEMKKESPDWNSVAQALSDIAHKADDVVRTIDRIRVLDRRLRNFDWHELKELRGYYQDLDDNERERLKQQISLERRKIIQEHAIVQLAERCERRHKGFRDTLDLAGRACSQQQREGTASRLSAAISLENQQNEDLKQLRQAEKRLLRLTKLKLKKEKS